MLILCCVPLTSEGGAGYDVTPKLTTFLYNRSENQTGSLWTGEPLFANPVNNNEVVMRQK